ncbi:hypothetical protein BDN70DRAFT_519738 [Pholiota conissans]|uniref:DUF7330 domain-containing protein n=1 Tax=Pholiota conissans TaxID=109636 RepID=A0A9P6CTT9_9AGAR|nr:hypothetical protein BDN70DRAFT_519738 [Pholiota conissans]
MMRGFHAYTLDTDLIIGDIGSKIRFWNVILNGNKSIDAKSLSMDWGFITSVGGTIRGAFNVSTSLTLTTSDGPIIADLTLNNTRGGILSVVAATTNSSIEITASLFSDLPPQPPRFNISATTTNSPIDINLLTAPRDAPLQVEVITTNGPANAYVHPSFQGKFQLSTEDLEPELHENRGVVVDPSGEARVR